MKRHLGPAAAGAVVIGLLAGCSSGTSAATTATSATATTAASPTPATVTISGTATPIPTTGEAAVCGSWSSSTSALAHAVASRYGGIESCFLYGHTWVITTDGLNGGPGYVGLAATCADSGCLSGSAAPGTFYTWTYFSAAKPGMVKLYAAPVAGMPLQVTVGGVQETFDVTTKTFGG